MNDVKELQIQSPKGKKKHYSRIEYLCKRPFVLKRRQFSLKICYAMAINFFFLKSKKIKSQCQILNNIGLYWQSPMFSHDQLYIALSWVRASIVDVSKIMPFYHIKCLLYYFTTSFYNIPFIRYFIIKFYTLK